MQVEDHTSNNQSASSIGFESQQVLQNIPVLQGRLVSSPESISTVKVFLSAATLHAFVVQSSLIMTWM